MEEEVASKQEELNELQSSMRAAKQNAPKDVQELRSAQDRSESAVAILQHKQLQIETKLEIEARVRDRVRKGRCPTCTQEIPPALKAARLNVLKRSLREMTKQLATIKRDLERPEEALQEGGYDESFDAFVDPKQPKDPFTA